MERIMKREKIKEKISKINKGCGSKFEKDNLVYILTFGLSGKPKEIKKCKVGELCPNCEKEKNHYENLLINKRRVMKCKCCGGTSFNFRWDYDEDNETELYMCHDGMGFQLEDSIISCNKCGKESLYSEEDFITTEVSHIR